MAVYDEGFAPHDGASRASSLINVAGAAFSLALIVGVGLWGYKLIMRDVSGIPVVRAMEGEMRVTPGNPGGAIAEHTGLAVNEVAAMGVAGGPEDRVVLAPGTPPLPQEDLTLPEETVAETPAVTAQSDDDLPALANQLVADALAENAAPAPDVIPATVPGVSRSRRPVLRPANLRVTADTSQALPDTNEVAVTTTPFPAGTNLVQLGAFQSPTLAAEEWQRLEGRFGQLMEGKGRVIQISNQSSGTWYRLRASGFEDRADARRFCTALEAEGANCIAVLVN